MSKQLNLDKILEDFANEVGGKVIPYTDSQSIIIMPTSHGRFQRVLGYTRIAKSQKVKFLEFDSKVCQFSESIDMKKYLEEAAHHTFCRIIIKDNYLQIASSVVVEHATADLIRDMVKEVSEVADDLEFQITGKDEN